MALSKVSTNQIDTAATPTVAEATVTGDLTVDTNTLVVDAANNRVGVGTASPAVNLDIVEDSASTDAILGITAGTGGRAQIRSEAQSDGTSSVLSFHTMSGSNTSEVGRWLAGGGLTFNGDTAAANALDDYEEGSYTPQISATNGIGTLTYSAQTGRYTKVGNRVMFNAYVKINQKGTVAGLLRITTPFTPANISFNHVAIAHWVNGSLNNQAFEGERVTYAYLAPNEPIVRFYSSNGDGGLNHLSAAHVKNGTDFMIQGTFQV